MNIRNFGMASGRLTRDPYIAKNSDGSSKVLLTIAAQNDFKNKDGKRDSQFINLEGFVPAGRELGVYNLMHKGDMIGVEYTVRTNNYTDKDGKPVYGQVLFIQSVDLKETKQTIAARNENTQADEPAVENNQPVMEPEILTADEDDAPF